MKKILALAILVCSPSLVTAQINYELPVVCAPTIEILTALKNDYKEKVSWSGEHANDKSVYSLWINDKTTAWTLLKMTPEVSCILGAGDKSNATFGVPVNWNEKK